MGECYICTDECYTLSPCKCKNAYLHQECYTRLIAYEHKQCSICLADFPRKEFSEESSERSAEISEGIPKLHPLWAIAPILMRPYPGHSFNNIDVALDIPRNVIWIMGYVCIFHRIDYPDQSLWNIFKLISIIEWLMCSILHFSLCVTIRHLLKRDRPRSLLLP